MASLPGKIPPGRPVMLGLPFHGKIVSGQMTLSNGTTITYSQPADGALTVVKHQKAAAPAWTEDEAAQLATAGKSYKDYAYLSGTTHKIGGQALGADRWLYCDGNRTWQMKYVKNMTDADQSNWRFEIWVEKLFGVFSDTEYETVNKLIYSYDLKESSVIGEHEWLLIYNPTCFWNKTGSKMLVNFRDVFSGTMGCAGFEYITSVPRAIGGSCGYRELFEVALFTLSGTGSTNLATLGDGISCSESLIWLIDGYPSYNYTEYGEAPDSLSYGYSGEGCLLDMLQISVPIDDPCPYDGVRSGAEDYSWGWTYAGTWFYFLTADDVAKAVTFTYSVARTFGFTFECTACESESSSGNPLFKNCYAASLYQSLYNTDTATHSVSYGGAEVINYSAATASTSGSETWDNIGCEYDGLAITGSTSEYVEDGWWRFADSGYFGGAWTGPGSQYLCVKTGSNAVPDISVVSLETSETLAAEVDDYYVYDFEGGQWYTAKTSIGFA